MADDLQKQLERAYSLIQREQTDEAIQMLRELMDEYGENADIWWLMANAVDDPRQARRSLVNVLKLNPRHSRARDLLEKLNESYPPRDDELMMMMEVPEAEDGFALPQAASQDDDIDFDDPFGEEAQANLSFDDDEDPFAELLHEDAKPSKRGKKGPSARPAKKRRSPVRTLLLFVLLLLVGAVAFIALTGGGEGDPGVVDVVAISPVVVEQTELQDILSATSTSVSTSTTPNFGPNSGAVYADTAVGRTLFVQGCVCTTADCQGPRPDDLSNLAFAGMNLAASRVSNAPETIRAEILAVGVNITGCNSTSPDTLYRAFVNLEAINEFNSNGDRAAFQARWTKEG